MVISNDSARRRGRGGVEAGSGGGGGDGEVRRRGGAVGRELEEVLRGSGDGERVSAMACSELGECDMHGGGSSGQVWSVGVWGCSRPALCLRCVLVWRLCRYQCSHFDAVLR